MVCLGRPYHFRLFKGCFLQSWSILKCLGLYRSITSCSCLLLEAFCKGRKDGNWRNPWNCHDYITCHAGYSFDRPCSIKTTMNYNPYENLCEYPYDYKCENISK